MPPPPRRPSAKPTYAKTGVHNGQGKELNWCESCGVIVFDEDLHDDRHARSLALVELPPPATFAHRNHHPPEGPPGLESEADSDSDSE